MLHYCLLWLFLFGNVKLDTGSSYTRDKNMDLTDDFKANRSMMLTLVSTCYLSCLIACDNNLTCTAVTYSNSTCTFYNKHPSFSSNTITRYAVDLYTKMTIDCKNSILFES